MWQPLTRYKRREGVLSLLFLSFFALILLSLSLASTPPSKVLLSAPQDGIPRPGPVARVKNWAKKLTGYLKKKAHQCRGFVNRRLARDTTPADGGTPAPTPLGSSQSEREKGEQEPSNQSDNSEHSEQSSPPPPSVPPSAKPTVPLTPEPTLVPTPEPTVPPTPCPSPDPTRPPTLSPSLEVEASMGGTVEGGKGGQKPSSKPSVKPSVMPSEKGKKSASCFKICKGATVSGYDPTITQRLPAVVQCHCPAVEPETINIDWDMTYVRFLVQIDNSTRGEFVVEVHASWAPFASQHFERLSNTGFFAGNRFFKVEKDFVAKFGLSGDPTANKAYFTSSLPPDGEIVESNRRGYLGFAPSSLEGDINRISTTITTEVYINYVDNPQLDDNGFVTFARVVEGMEVIDSLYATTEYQRGPEPFRIHLEGNRYLEAKYKDLSYIIGSRVEKKASFS
uniref:PPIase cyclophilin-type domain-containing protein n=2 Tax=Amorphochlora amoebiformis TaxID=1561963 RepID=A0A7S0DBQ7_9EUKA